jgi:hypothetical protein
MLHNVIHNVTISFYIELYSRFDDSWQVLAPDAPQAQQKELAGEYVFEQPFPFIHGSHEKYRKVLFCSGSTSFHVKFLESDIYLLFVLHQAALRNVSPTLQVTCSMDKIISLTLWYSIFHFHEAQLKCRCHECHEDSWSSCAFGIWIESSYGVDGVVVHVGSSTMFDVGSFCIRPRQRGGGFGEWQPSRRTFCVGDPFGTFGAGRWDGMGCWAWSDRSDRSDRSDMIW